MNTKTVARYKPTNRPDLVSQAVARLNHVLALMSQRLAGPHQCFPPRDHEPLRLEPFPAEVGPGSAKKTRQSIDRERFPAEVGPGSAKKARQSIDRERFPAEVGPGSA